MPLITVILLLTSIYLAVDARFVLSNEVQKASEIISDDYGEEYKLVYNKSASLVRKKRVAILVTVMTTIGVQYICRLLASMTPFDNALKRWALKYWGFRDGREAARWKELAKFVYRNVTLDGDGNIFEIRDFIDAPQGLESQVERFRKEATLTMTKIMEDEAEQEAIMEQQHQKNREQSINAPVLLSKVKSWRDLDQLTKAMMADNMIFTLLGINGTGEATWKVNFKKPEHRKIYEALLQIKAAIDSKYKDRCPLQKITAKELPELKAWYERLWGAVPDWFQNLFKGVKTAEHEKAEMDKELIKKIEEIHDMAEQVLMRAEEVAKIAREENLEKMKLAGQNKTELTGPLKNIEVGKGPELMVKIKKE